MNWTSRTLVLAAIGFAGLAAPASAQDGRPKAAAETSDPAELLRRMETLYPKATATLSPPTPGEDPKVAAERAKAFDERQAAIRGLAKAGDDYLAAIGDGAPDARALYFRGVGKLAAGSIVSVGEKRDAYAAAIDSFQRYLDGTDEKAAFRSDAEMGLGKSLLFAARIDDAVLHLKNAVELLQKEGRHEDAGVCAYLALAQLKALSQMKEMRAFAEAVHAKDADFGGSTPTIRALVAASNLGVGAPLPEIPAVKDVDDKPISFAAGKPLLLHFFLTAQITGHATKFKDVDETVRPLWEKFHDKGLRVVSVCMDREIPAAEVERIKKNWEEWGTKDELRDGSLDSTRAWAAKHGMEWTLRWSGKWINDPVSQALGGVGATSPFAVLVDKDGVVRWTGDPGKPDGLADEAAKLFK